MEYQAHLAIGQSCTVPYDCTVFLLPTNQHKELTVHLLPTISHPLVFARYSILKDDFTNNERILNLTLHANLL